MTETTRPPRADRRRFLGALAATLALAACDTTDPALQAASETPTAPVEIRLAAGDKLKITVFGEEQLTGEYEIDSNGTVSMPLAGTVEAAGLTKIELERRLSGKLSGSYLKNPRVTVEVTSSRPFYILGEVEKPGEYPYRAGLNIMSAIAVAGGNTYRASRSKVYIQRNGQGSFQEVPLGPTIPVYPGDVIKVPERYF
jgi:protein involved in polysaccharide export with SLBB domain